MTVMFRRLGIPKSAFYKSFLNIGGINMLEFIIMFRDECGDDRRAYGEFSKQTFSYARFDESNEHMVSVFEAWQEAVIRACEDEWNATHDIPMYFFMEESTRSKWISEVW